MKTEQMVLKEGGTTARKYMAITKTSKATANRDLQQLQELGAGRSVRYKAVIDEDRGHSQKLHSINNRVSR